MAVFNPEISPTKDPDWKKDFRPISDIPADKSAGMALSLIGDTLSGVVGLVDTGIKKSLSDEAYAKADIAQTTDQRHLEGVREAITGDAEPTLKAAVPAAGSPLSLVPQANQGPAEGDEKPQGLTSGVAQVNRLGAAVRSNPNLNDTWYSMMADSTAKELRARFPGYREYIDEVTSKAFGVNVANAYRNNMRSDINNLYSQMAQKKDAFLEGMLKRTDIPQMTQFYNEYKADPNSTTIQERWFSLVNKFDSTKTQIDRDLQNMQLQAARGKVTGEDWFRLTSKMIAKGQEYGITSLVKREGLDDPKLLSASDDMKMEKMARLGPVVAQDRVKAQAEVEKLLDQEVPVDGNKTATRRSLMTKEQIDAIRSQATVQYDNYLTGINGNDPKQFAMVYLKSNILKGSVNDISDDLFKSPAGFDLKTIAALTANIDPQIVNQHIINDTIRTKLDAGIAQWMEGAKVLAATNSNRPRGDASGDASLTRRFGKDWDAVKSKAGVTGGGVSQELFRALDIMSDPKATTEQKQNILDYFIGAGQNPRYLRNFEIDKSFIGDANSSQGRGAMFALLTSPKVVAAIKSLPDTDQAAYRTAIFNMYAGDIVNADLNTINSIKGEKNLQLRWNDGSDKSAPLGYTLVDTVNKIVFTPTWMTNTEKLRYSGAFGMNPRFSGAKQAESLYRVNYGLEQLAKAYQGLGDPRPLGTIMLEALHSQTSFTPAGNAQGLPSEMIQAIREQEAKAKQTPKDRARKYLDPKSVDESSSEALPYDQVPTPNMTLGGWLSGLDNLRNSAQTPRGPIITPAQVPVQQTPAQAVPEELVNNPAFDRYDPATGRTYMRNGMTQDQINKMKDAENRAKRKQ